jgi:hypothetical protein
MIPRPERVVAEAVDQLAGVAEGLPVRVLGPDESAELHAPHSN